MSRPSQYRTMSTKIQPDDEPKKSDIVYELEKIGKKIEYIKFNKGEWNEFRLWTVDGHVIYIQSKGHKIEGRVILNEINFRFPSIDVWVNEKGITESSMRDIEFWKESHTISA